MSGAGSQLHFRGALALPDDAEPSLIVDLRVEDEVVVITQDNEQIGVWNIEEVDAERLNGQKFLLQLGDDEVIFHARDRLGFAYNGINALKEAKQRREDQRNKWWFERLVDADADSPTATELFQRGRAQAAKMGTRLRRVVGREKPVTARLPASLVDHPEPEADPGSTEPVADVEVEQTREPAAESAQPQPKTKPQPTPVPPPMPVAVANPTTTLPEDSTEPWDLPDQPEQARSDERPLGLQPSKKPRGGHRLSRRAEGEADDPWAMVADYVLKRDDGQEGSDRPQSKRLSREDHQHDYEETKLPGGLVRRICSCGEVVIRSID